MTKTILFHDSGYLCLFVWADSGEADATEQDRHHEGGEGVVRSGGRVLEGAYGRGRPGGLG